METNGYTDKINRIEVVKDRNNNTLNVTATFSEP